MPTAGWTKSGPAYWQLADYFHANQRQISGSQQNVQDSFTKIDQATLDFGKKNNVDIPKLQACMKAPPDAVVKASMAEGDKLNISATPTLFINGERVERALDAKDLRFALNRQLKAEGSRTAASAAGARKAGAATAGRERSSKDFAVFEFVNCCGSFSRAPTRSLGYVPPGRGEV